MLSALYIVVLVAIAAALLAVAILAARHPEYKEKLRAYRAAQARKVLEQTLE